MNTKKAIAAVIVLAMITGAAGSVLPEVSFLNTEITASAEKTATSGYCGKNLTWSLSTDGTLTISGTGDMTDWYGDTTPFYNTSDIKKAVIKDGVTSIGDYAFCGCTNLKDISIPKTVSRIGMNAFKDTKWLEKRQSENPMVIVNNILIDGKLCRHDVVIPKGVTCIGEGAFADCEEIWSVVIPEGVTVISSEAFKNCYMKSVKLPESLTTIEDRAFDICQYLTDITIPKSVTNIGGSALDGTEWLYTMREKNPMVIVNNILIDGEECTGDVVIPDGVTSIAADAFSHYSQIKTLTVPDSVKSIGSYAFSECKKLESVKLPKSMTSIDSDAFNHCEKLENIEMPQSMKSLGDRAFRYCSSLKSITIPDGIANIEEDTFKRCSALEKVTLPDSVTEIGEGAFWECENLKSVSIPDGVTIIDYRAFQSCSALESVKIPYSVKTIGFGAFSNCGKLKKVAIPGSVLEIGDYAFGYIYNSKEEVPMDKFTIYGEEGSAAQSYAKENEFMFIELLSIVTTGDVNLDGKIDIEDAVMAINYINGNMDLDKPNQFEHADIDGNGKIDIEDAVAIIAHVNGIKAIK